MFVWLLSRRRLPRPERGGVLSAEGPWRQRRGHGQQQQRQEGQPGQEPLGAEPEDVEADAQGVILLHIQLQKQVRAKKQGLNGSLRVSDDEGQFEEDDIKREPSVNSLNKIVPIPDASAFFIFAAKNK